MADINIKPEIALGLKQQDPMISLGNMLNAANAITQFKQAQQINPLALQKTQQEVEQGATTLEKSKFNLNQEYADKAAAGVSALMSSPHFQPDANGNFNQAAMLQDVDAIERVLTAQGVKKHPSGAIDVLREKIKANPASGADFLRNIAMSQLGASEKVGYAIPQEATLGGVPALRNKVTGAITPLPNQEQLAGVSPQDMNAPPPDEKFVGGMTYPVRKPGQPFIPQMSEGVDLKAGQDYRQGLAVSNQNLPKMKRDLGEADALVDKIRQNAVKIGGLDSASGTFGTLTRKYKDIVGDPEYKQLSKDLANLQLANLQASGVASNSVEGIKLQGYANGDETYPPDVLANILGRMTADVTNRELQQVAAEKFSRRFGDQNIKHFQQQWNSNAGNGKVFQAIHLYQTKGQNEQTIDEVNELLGEPDSKERAENTKRFKNLWSLYNYGYIPKEKK